MPDSWAGVLGQDRIKFGLAGRDTLGTLGGLPILQFSGIEVDRLA